MLNASKLDKQIKRQKKNVSELAAAMKRAGLSIQQAQSAIGNWRKGLLKPLPRGSDIEAIASALGVETNGISEWKSSVRYAPMSPKKARLVTQLVAGRGAQEAMDLLKFTRKRAAYIVQKALKSAIASADEASADVENLYVCQARVDSAGVRIGTKRYQEKDRGKAYGIRKMGSHIHITVTEME
jgi:large subunit ribosomal protein L22